MTPISMNQTLGIIVCIPNNTQKVPPFPEALYFYHLAKIAKQHQLETLIFNPKQINWTKRTTPAWYLEKDKWKLGIRKLPLVIYDRCYYTNAMHFQSYRPHILRIHHDRHVQFLGRALGGKIQTHQMLSTNEEIKDSLPETHLITNEKTIQKMLKKYDRICIKPNGGSHGIGVVSVKKTDNGFHIKGRTKHNFPFEKFISTENELLFWVKSFIQKTRYLIQPFLSLHTKDGLPFDLRILVQKNGEQQWQTTGSAIRIGKSQSITSNLHGGGSAIKFLPFLANHFQMDQVEAIKQQIERLTKIIPIHIEKQHGKLVELGLDVGIDQNAKVWIIELNSKPGRSVFLQTGEIETRKRSMEPPVQYAKALLSQKVGGF